MLERYTNLHYWPGWLADTLKQYGGGPIAFANVDCDYYESAKKVLVFLDENVAPGATINIDDYGSWPSARKAADDWLASTPLKIKQTIKKRIGPMLVRLA